MPASKCDGSTRLTHVPSGTSVRGTFARTFVQDLPASRVTCTLPSSVPAQITPASTGDSTTLMSVACVSAPPRSPIAGAGPDVSSGLLVDKSGLMISHVSPRSALRIRRLLPRYTIFESCGERISGELQLYRSCGARPSAA